MSALAALLFSASRFSAESAISLYCCDDVRELASCCFRLPHSFLLWFSCSCRSLYRIEQKKGAKLGELTL